MVGPSRLMYLAKQPTLPHIHAATKKSMPIWLSDLCILSQYNLKINLQTLAWSPIIIFILPVPLLASLSLYLNVLLLFFFFLFSQCGLWELVVSSWWQGVFSRTSVSLSMVSGVPSYRFKMLATLYCSSCRGVKSCPPLSLSIPNIVAWFLGKYYAQTKSLA